MVMKVMAIQQSNPRFWGGGNMATKVMMNSIPMEMLMLTYEDPGANDGANDDCTSLNKPQGLFQSP